MAQNNTVYLENSYVHPPLYLTEALWISATAPDRVPYSSISGGGGPGFGGWGLSAGRPRGTGGPSQFVHEKGWRTVFGEEMSAVNLGYAKLYAPSLQTLTAQVEADRVAIEQQADAASSDPAQAMQLRQSLTTASLKQRRAE